MDVGVSFSGWNAPRPHEHRQIYRIMTATYNTHRYLPLQPWSISIYPVPRELRSVVRLVLIPGGLDLIRAWFIEPRSKLWLAERHAFRLQFVVATGNLEHDTEYE